MSWPPSFTATRTAAGHSSRVCCSVRAPSRSPRAATTPCASRSALPAVARAIRRPAQVRSTSSRNCGPSNSPPGRPPLRGRSSAMSAQHFRCSTRSACSPTPSGCSSSVPRRLLTGAAAAVAFVRGSSWAAGRSRRRGRRSTSSSPSRAPISAEVLVALLGRLGLEFHVVERDRNVACYTKRGETAADLLATLGAHDARLRGRRTRFSGRCANAPTVWPTATRPTPSGRRGRPQRQVERARAVLDDARAWACCRRPCARRRSCASRTRTLSLEELAAAAPPASVEVGAQPSAAPTSRGPSRRVVPASRGARDVRFAPRLPWRAPRARDACRSGRPLVSLTAIDGRSR